MEPVCGWGRRREEEPCFCYRGDLLSTRRTVLAAARGGSMGGARKLHGRRWEAARGGARAAARRGAKGGAREPGGGAMSQRQERRGWGKEREKMRGGVGVWGRGVGLQCSAG